MFDALTEAVAAEPERYPQWAGRLPSYAEGTCPGTREQPSKAAALVLVLVRVRLYIIGHARI